MLKINHIFQLWLQNYLKMYTKLYATVCYAIFSTSNLISTYSFLNSPIHFHSYILSTNVYWVPTISSPVFYIHIINVATVHPMAPQDLDVPLESLMNSSTVVRHVGSRGLIYWFKFHI